MQSGLKPLGRERWWVLLLLAPTLIGLLFGAFGSVAATVGISFLNWDLLTPPKWAGLDNFAKLLTRQPVSEIAGQYLCLQQPLRPSGDRPVAGGGAAAQPQNSRRRPVPRDLFSAGGVVGGGGRAGLDVDLRARYRAC